MADSHDACRSRLEKHHRMMGLCGQRPCKGVLVNSHRLVWLLQGETTPTACPNHMLPELNFPSVSRLLFRGPGRCQQEGRQQRPGTWSRHRQVGGSKSKASTGERLQLGLDEQQQEEIKGADVAGKVGYTRATWKQKCK